MKELPDADAMDGLSIGERSRKFAEFVCKSLGPNEGWVVDGLEDLVRGFARGVIRDARGHWQPATPAAEGTRPMETKSLTFSEFSSINRTRCESPKGFSHALDSWSLSDWMTATAGELGEAANVVKKLNRVRDGIPGNDKSPEELRAMLADELADVFIYLDLMAQAAGVDLPTAVVTKFEKTSVKIGYIGDGLDVQGKPLAGKELASDLEDGCSR